MVAGGFSCRKIALSLGGFCDWSKHAVFRLFSTNNRNTEELIRRQKWISRVLLLTLRVTHFVSSNCKKARLKILRFCTGATRCLRKSCFYTNNRLIEVFRSIAIFWFSRVGCQVLKGRFIYNRCNFTFTTWKHWRVCTTTKMNVTGFVTNSLCYRLCFSALQNRRVINFNFFAKKQPDICGKVVFSRIMDLQKFLDQYPFAGSAASGVKSRKDGSPRIAIISLSATWKHWRVRGTTNMNVTSFVANFFYY